MNDWLFLLTAIAVAGLEFYHYKKLKIYDLKVN